MDEMTQNLILRKAESIRVFADGNPTFVWGDWKGWVAACRSESRMIPPAEFKARPEDQRRAYLKTPNG